MKNGQEESIRKIIESAKQERDNLIQYIDLFISNILPATKEEISAEAKNFQALAKKINIPFQSPDENARNILDSYIEKLIPLKEQLASMQIDEDTLMESSLIEKTQEIIDLAQPSIGKVKRKFTDSSINNLLKSYEEKEEIKSKIFELKTKKEYLTGALDATKKEMEKSVFGNKRRGKEINDLTGKIYGIDAEIASLENKLSRLNYYETIDPSQADSKQENDIVKTDGEKTAESLEKDDMIL